MSSGSYFNPHSPVGSDPKRLFVSGRYGISTHTPRMGSDLQALVFGDGVSLISTHTPRVGSDP